MKSKKSQVILYILFLAFVISIFTFLFYNSVYKTGKENYEIGTKSLEIIKSDKESQKDLVFIDQAAKLSAYNAVYELALNGGYSEDYSSKFNGFSVLKEPYPEYKSNFKYYFDKYMNQHLLHLSARLAEQKEVYTRITGTGLYSKLLFKRSDPLNLNYNLFFNGNYLYGFTEQFIEKRIDREFYNFRLILPKEEGITLLGFSLINPSFNIDLNYNIDEYNALISDSKILVDYCKNKDDKESCVNERLAYFKNWKLIDSENNIFAFEVSADKKIMVDEFRPLTYRFALDLSSLTS